MMNEWISVKDRMHENDGRYLVFEKHYESSEFGWVGVSSLRNGIWDSSSIHAWQPLPEPPNE